MKVADVTRLEVESSPVKGNDSPRGKSIGSNPKSQQIIDIPTKDMEAILDDLRKSFCQYGQKSLSLNVPIENFIQLRNGNQILGINRDGQVTAIDCSSYKVRDKHFSHAFTGIVANISETQAFLPTQEGWLVVLDISDIFRLRIVNQVQCFDHPVDAIRILSSDLLIVYDFNGVIETLKLQDSQILKVEYVEYQTALSASSIVSPNGEYLLFYNHQSMCVVDRRGNKIYESDRETRNCCLSDDFFAYMTQSLEGDEIHVRRLTDPFNLFITIYPDKRDTIAQLYLSEDSQYVMGVIHNQSSKIWDLFDQKSECAIDLETDSLFQLNFGKNNAILYSTANSFFIDFFLEFCSPKSIDLDNPGTCIENFYEGKIVITSWDSLREIDLSTGNAIEFSISESTKVTALRHFDEDIFCVGILSNSFHMMRMKFLRSHDIPYERNVPLDSEAMCIEITKDKHLIFVGCFYGEVVTIETNNLTIQSKKPVEGTPTSLLYTEDYGLICGLDNGCIQKLSSSMSFECHSGSITSLAYSSKGMLVSCSTDGRIGIWNLEDLKSISFLNFHATTIKISNNGQYLYSMSENGIFNCWCLETLNCLFTEDHRGYHRFFITESERHMVLVDQTSLKIIDGPLMETVRVTGTAKKKDFIEYTRKLITKGTTPEFEEEMENGVILPFMIAPIHLYADLNLNEHLKLSLLKGSPVFNSSSGLNPLKIAAKRENGDCFMLLIKSLKRNENPHALGFVNTNTLISLNYSSVPCLSKLYDRLFQKSSSKSLAALISTSTKLPHYELSDNKTIQENEFISKSTKDSQKVVYWESQFKLCFEPKMSEGMEFLSSIAKTENNEFLTSNFINRYLSFKWTKVRLIVYLRFILYFAYLILVVCTLYIDIEGKENRSSYINLVVILTILIAMSEVILLYKFPDRFVSIWSWLELIRLASVTVYTISFTDDDDDGSDINYLNYFTIDDVRINLVTWTFVQGFSYFRAFYPTRCVVHLIVKVFNDLQVYLILLAYTIFCISCVLYVFLRSELNLPLIDYFLISTGLSFANFDVDDFYGRPLTAIFSILLNTLVMLNLVIAIIGDTYDKVQDNREIANNKELAQLILETESLMFWKRKKENLKYFHVCDWDNNNSGKPEWLGRVRELKLILKKQDKDFKDIKKSLEQKLDLFKKETDQKLDLILSK